MRNRHCVSRSVTGFPRPCANAKDWLSGPAAILQFRRFHGLHAAAQRSNPDFFRLSTAIACCCLTVICMALLEPDATTGRGYSENPTTSAIFRERMWRLDPSSPLPLWIPCFSWNWLDLAFATPELAGESLVSGNRRAARFVLGFGRDDRRRRQDLHYCVADPPVQGPSPSRRTTCNVWTGCVHLAHAFRRAPLGGERAEDRDPLGAAGVPVAGSEMILTSDGKIVFQTNSVEYLLNRVLAGEPGNYTHNMPVGERLPSPVQMLIRRIVGAAKGDDRGRSWHQALLGRGPDPKALSDSQ
jgi:hypothetical protein